MARRSTRSPTPSCYLGLWLLIVPSVIAGFVVLAAVAR